MFELLGKLISSCPDCPEINLSDPAQTGSLYQDFLSSSVNQDALLISSTAELGTHVDLATIFADVINDPAAYIGVDPDYGVGHAALTYLWLTDPSNSILDDFPEVQNAGTVEEILAYWYSREAMARCADCIDCWEDPNCWNEDSRLDYMTVIILVNWFNDQPEPVDCCDSIANFINSLNDGTLIVDGTDLTTET